MSALTLKDSIHTLQRALQLYIDKYGYDFLLSTDIELLEISILTLNNPNVSLLDILKIQEEYEYIKNEFQKKDT
jgi:hypothetical protein